MRKCPKCKREFASNERVCPDDGSLLDDSVREEDRVIGMTLDGKYKIEGFVKRGGMGAVYRGTHLMLGKPVAIKLIKPELVSSKEIVERFLREARSAAQLAHPNIVTVHDLGQTEDGTLYIAMELVDGRSLKEIIVKEGHWEPERAVRLTKGIARALALAHRKGVVHRDLKPQNIMVSVDADGHEIPKLLDFGIARTLEPDTPALTSTGMVLGTPHYMSSEQAKGLPADARSDLYALGIILYEMLVGKVPFEDKSIPTLLVKHMSEPPPPPTTIRSDVPIWLEAVVLRCLEKNPDDRFSSAEALIDVLDNPPSESLEKTAVVPAPAPVPVPPVGEQTIDQSAPAPGPQHTGAGGSIAAMPAPPPPATPATPPPVPVSADGGSGAGTGTGTGTGAPATIRKRDLHEVESPGPQPVPARPPAPTPASRPRQYSSGNKAGVWIALGSVILLLAVVGFALFRSAGTSDDADSVNQAAVASVSPDADTGTASSSSEPPAGGEGDASGSTGGDPGSGARSGDGSGAGGGSSSSGGGASAGLAPAPQGAAATAERQSNTKVEPPTESEPVAESNRPGAAARQRVAARRRAAQAQQQAAPAPPAEAPPAKPPMPDRPSVHLSCDGVRDGCAALRFTIQESFQNNNLPIVPARNAEIIVSLEVEEVEARSEQNFGTTFIMRTYSMSASGEVPRFGEFLSLPPRVFTFDARVGREKLREQSRLVASDLARRIEEFWERKK
jgi:serine/threonine-protein kinase